MLYIFFSLESLCSLKCYLKWIHVLIILLAVLLTHFPHIFWNLFVNPFEREVVFVCVSFPFPPLCSPLLCSYLRSWSKSSNPAQPMLTQPLVSGCPFLHGALSLLHVWRTVMIKAWIHWPDLTQKSVKSKFLS